MKKIVAIMLAGILCAGVLTGCGGSTGAAKTEDTKEEAVESTEGAEGAATAESAEEGRVFTVGFDAEYPPYGYKDETTGDYTGFDLELAEEVCKRRGWTLKKQPIDWDAKDMEINSGAIDCLWNGMTYNGR